ncbi:2-nitropropane dioxygenase [Bacteroidia bacterium]|nr:2-nitropropane dioxygenase [Bacteroidia bacterium]
MRSFFIGDMEIRLPIVQGGMGVGISLSGLSAAVANEGGIGVISCAGLGLVYSQPGITYFEACILGLREEIRKARERSSGIIGVNIMVALSNFADMVRTAIEEKIDIIFAGAGLPLDLPSFLPENCHSKIVPIVSSDRAARIICEKWQTRYNYLPDAIVVEGPKAGGHLGFKKVQLDDENYSIENLVKNVKDIVVQYKSQKTISVIAAGGISTGQDIRRMMELGADGVQMASIFVTTNECDASKIFKDTYIDSKEEDVMIIDSPVGMPGRAISNVFLERVKEGLEVPTSCPFNCIKTCDYKNSPYCIILALYQASVGNMKKGYAFAGSNAYKATEIRSVREVIEQLKSEYLRDI